VLRFSIRLVLGAAAASVAFATANAQQESEPPQLPQLPEIHVTLNPFVTFVPAQSAGPMTGLALSLASGPLAIRAGGHISLRDRNAAAAANSAVSTRPWGADADALAYFQSFLYGTHVAFTPYVFAGVGTSSVDSGAYRLNRQGWSYGTGASLPLVSALGAFAEARWRMNRFVLPTATGAPAATSEFRLGFAFHVGGGHGSPTVGPGGDAITLAGAVSEAAMRVLSTADQFIGTPYRRGGVSPNAGFDASGFVRFVFARLGVNLPRSSRDQARVGDRIKADWHVIAPGDLVMFQDDGGINHVAIYVGHNRIVHSSETGGGVRYDDLGTERGRWFLDHMVAARRVTPDMRGLLIDLARGYSTDASNADRPDHAPRASLKRR
jgi:hypothetical protein